MLFIPSTDLGRGKGGRGEGRGGKKVEDVGGGKEEGRGEKVKAGMKVKTEVDGN